MAADDDKKTAPEVVNTNSDSENLAQRSKLGLSHSRKKTALTALAALVVAAAVAWFLVGVQHLGQKVYAQAAGHKIYKKEIQSFIGNVHGVTYHNAAKVLADKYLTEAMAKQQGIVITNKDILNAYGAGINIQKNKNKYSYQLQVNQLYFNRLQAYNQGYYKGRLLVAHFSRYIAYQSPLLKEQKAQDHNVGNPAVIAQDKKYAQGFINGLYEQIRSGGMTFDQAIKTEHNNPKVGDRAYPTLTHSGSFDTSSPYVRQNGLIQASSIQKQIHSIKPGQISKPFVVRVSNSIDGTATAESYFLVVKMDSSRGGNNGMSFAQELERAEKRLGYKVNV